MTDTHNRHSIYHLFFSSAYNSIQVNFVSQKNIVQKLIEIYRILGIIAMIICQFQQHYQLVMRR